LPGSFSQIENLKDGNIMFWKLLPWLFYGIIFSTILGIAYFFTAMIYGPKAAIKSLAQALAIIGVLSIVFYVLSPFITPSQRDILWTLLYLALSIISVIVLFLQIRGKRQAASETLLLDLGLDKNGFLILLIGVVFLVSPISSIIDSFETSQFVAKDLLSIVFKVLIGILGVYKGINNTVLTDGGIFSLYGYVNWTNIKSYQWEESKPPLLNLKLAGSWFSLNRSSIIVPQIHRGTVQDLLSQKLAGPENAGRLKNA
jgi:hypothetical protein